MDLFETCHFCGKSFSAKEITRIAQNSLKKKFKTCPTCKEALKELGLIRVVYKKEPLKPWTKIEIEKRRLENG